MRAETPPAEPFSFAGFKNRQKVGALEGVRGLVRALPRARAVALGAAVGRAYARVHGPRTGVARINLAIAYPGLPARERKRLLIDTYANFGRMVAETALLQGLSREELLEVASIEGLEHLETARKATPHGGVIVLTAHFGSFELFAAIMARSGVPLSIVYRTANNPYLDRMITGWREDSGIELIPRGVAARAVLRSLRSGRVVVMPLDQDTRDQGVFVPFFGRLASTRDGPARLAMHVGAPVVPAFMFRIGDGLRHQIRVFPALALEPGSADRAATDAAVLENVRRMSAAIEAAVREAPTQWIWSHRRWKTQPEGMVRPYRRKADRPLRRLQARLGLRRQARSARRQSAVPKASGGGGRAKRVRIRPLPRHRRSLPATLEEGPSPALCPESCCREVSGCRGSSGEGGWSSRACSCWPLGQALLQFPSRSAPPRSEPSRRSGLSSPTRPPRRAE